MRVLYASCMRVLYARCVRDVCVLLREQPTRVIKASPLQDEIAEMKRKFKIMNHQIEQLKEEIQVRSRAQALLELWNQPSWCLQQTRARALARSPSRVPGQGPSVRQGAHRAHAVRQGEGSAQK